jgi:anaerobic magnesium-protoporphyrin IX monomethyl ester cyclase
VKITLIHPPIDDPTVPYHSTAYLAGHLVHNGFNDVVTRDLNIEFVNYCLEERTINSFYAEGEKRLSRFGEQPGLDLLGQEEYLGLWKCRRIDSEELRRASGQLRQHESFLDYSLYQENIALLERYFGFLGALSYPAGISNFRQVSKALFSIYNFDDLFNMQLSGRICHPFSQFFTERLAHDPELERSDCFGISIVYDHQMTHALWLARALKRQWPNKLVVLGGTSLSQYYKYLKDKLQMKRFFSMCDALVVGEGETAICRIAESGGDRTKLAGICNTITYDSKSDHLRFPVAIHYENLPALGPPLYKYPWHLYLAPERGINYAPTRGCYWNRCTFCDYGLNTAKPTSPWRERRIDQVIADLQTAITTDKIKYVYLAVDVMAPGYLERLSDAILEARLDIRWGGELRMEKIFLPERCKKMAKAGCVCVSFGMESGNQRILDLIDKGTKVQYMGETMKNFAEAGIPVQLMAFRDFPTETLAERNETLKFIASTREYWSTGGIGTFVLTGTALVAKNPDRFGIKLLETKEMDVARGLAYSTEGETIRTRLLTEEYDTSFDDHGDIFPDVLGRPWAGGTDSLHSMIYYDAYGRKFFKDFSLPDPDRKAVQTGLELLECLVRMPARLSRSPFDISLILVNCKTHKQHVKDLIRAFVEPTHAELVRWQGSVPVVHRSNEKDTYWIATEKRSMKLDKLAYRVLSAAAGQLVSLREILSAFGGDVRERLLVQLETMAEAGLLELSPSAESRATRAAPGAGTAATQAALPACVMAQSDLFGPRSLGMVHERPQPTRQIPSRDQLVG